MEALAARLPHLPYTTARRLTLLDTSFLISELQEGSSLLHATPAHPFAMTSFNLSELFHAVHSLPHVKEPLRRFLKRATLTIIDVPARPGEWEAERAFVASVEPQLLRIIPDVSDAVLAAAALATHSNILTKDKHHLFTTRLEDFLTRDGITVWKELKDALVTVP